MSSASHLDELQAARSLLEERNHNLFMQRKERLDLEREQSARSNAMDEHRRNHNNRPRPPSPDPGPIAIPPLSPELVDKHYALLQPIYDAKLEGIQAEMEAQFAGELASMDKFVQLRGLQGHTRNQLAREGMGKHHPGFAHETNDDSVTKEFNAQRSRAPGLDEDRMAIERRADQDDVQQRGLQLRIAQAKRSIGEPANDGRDY